MDMEKLKRRPRIECGRRSKNHGYIVLGGLLMIEKKKGEIQKRFVELHS